MSVLDDVRLKLSKIGVNEQDVRDKQAGLVEIFKELQQVRYAMNAEKIKAANEAAVPYLQKIDELEKKYALLLRINA
jgi:hypothetical protein